MAHYGGGGTGSDQTGEFCGTVDGLVYLEGTHGKDGTTGHETVGPGGISGSRGNSGNGGRKK